MLFLEGSLLLKNKQSAMEDNVFPCSACQGWSISESPEGLL